MGSLEAGNPGSKVRCLRPKNRWAGLYPSGLGVFLNYSNTARKSLSLLVINVRCLQFLTAASASPLEDGLYGLDSSCLMKCCLQNDRKSDLNWGPPSVRQHRGNPRSLNHARS